MEIYKFYTTKGGVNEQKGLYEFLHIKKGVPVETIIECLEEYSSRYIMSKQPPQRKFILQCVCFTENFSKFLAIVTEKTGLTFKKNTSRKQRKGKDTYDDWFARASSDGSFAYNGCTDDF